LIGKFIKRGTPGRVARGPSAQTGLVTGGQILPPEFMSELRPPAGLGKLRKLAYNDPVAGGLILHFRVLVSGLGWRVEDPAPWLQPLLSQWGGLSPLIFDMTSALIYGFWVAEPWLTADYIKDLIPLIQTSIVQFTTEGVEQSSPTGYARVPWGKIVHFAPVTEGASPWGVPLCRQAYKPWWFKSKAEEAEAMSIDRDVGGLPVMTAPEDFDFAATIPGSPMYSEEAAQTLEWAKSVIRELRNAKLRGLVKPAGWTLEMLRAERGPDVHPTIQRYNTEICLALLQSFSALGLFSERAGGKVGSFVEMFLGAVDWLAERVAQTIQSQLLDRWQGLYGSAGGKVAFRRATPVNMKDLASYVARLASQGVIEPTGELERALLELVDLPAGEEVKDAERSQGKDQR